MTVVINSKKQFNINDTLALEEIFSLDIGRLDVANSVNLTKWLVNHETYLSFARGRKDVSIYFRSFIGCTDQTSAKQSSTKFKGTFLDYLRGLEITNEEKARIKQEVHDYCTRKTKAKEDILLEHVSSLIDPENPGLFSEFASDETHGVDANIKGHLSTLRDLKYYSYKSENLNISFDSKLVGQTIFYYPDLNELKIKEVPENLKRQLLNEIDNEN